MALFHSLGTLACTLYSPKGLGVCRVPFWVGLVASVGWKASFHVFLPLSLAAVVSPSQPSLASCENTPLDPPPSPFPSLLSSALTPPVSLAPPAPPGGPLALHPAPTALPFLGSHVHLTLNPTASQVRQPLLGWAEASCWLLRPPGCPNLFCWGTAPLPTPRA